LSERRHHLAGTLGAAVMNRFTELNWAARDSAPGSRVVQFHPHRRKTIRGAVRGDRRNVSGGNVIAQ